MWFLRRMMRIPWTTIVTNEEVLRRDGTEMSIRERKEEATGIHGAHPER